MLIFTRLEWEIIEHRLGAPDAICELASFEYGIDPQNVSEAICAAIESDGRCADGVIETLVIKDCCEGSTFFNDIDDAILDGEISKSKALAYRRAAASLERKTGARIPR